MTRRVHTTFYRSSKEKKAAFEMRPNWPAKKNTTVARQLGATSSHASDIVPCPTCPKYDKTDRYKPDRDLTTIWTVGSLPDKCSSTRSGYRTRQDPHTRQRPPLFFFLLYIICYSQHFHCSGACPARLPHSPSSSSSRGRSWRRRPVFLSFWGSWYWCQLLLVPLKVGGCFFLFYSWCWWKKL